MQIEQTNTSAATVIYRVRWRERDGRRSSRRFDTSREARAFVATEQLRHRLLNVDHDRITLEEYFRQVWAPVYAATLSRSNRAAYQYIYARHIGPYLGSRPLREISAEAVATWQARHARVSGDLHSTRRALLVLSAILQTAVRSRYLKLNPARGAKATVAAR